MRLLVITSILFPMAINRGAPMQVQKRDSSRPLIVPTQQSPVELELLALFPDPKYTFDAILVKAQKFFSATQGDEEKKAVGKYIITLKTMAERQKERINEKTRSRS